jgi:hypothetical protein
LNFVIRDLSCEFAGEANGVEGSDFVYTASAGAKAVPHIAGGQAKRRYRTKTCYSCISHSNFLFTIDYLLFDTDCRTVIIRHL